MNGYKMMADSYRKVLQRDREQMDPAAIADMKANIRVFDALATFEGDDKFRAFDSSMFNDVFKGYIEKIMDELTEDEDEEIREAAKKIKSRVNGKASGILDRIGAKEAEAYYYNN